MIKTDALIIGAGPTGLFTAHQLKLIGLNCEIVDNLDKIGGQCIELYPDKPIYDIPAIPECTGEELTNNLIEQLKPFNIKFHLSERVDELKKNNSNWEIKTNKGTKFSTPNVIIAGGVGSFEPRKFNLKECEKYENNSVLYSVKDKSIFKGKTVSIFGGGDSAIDWALELSKDSKVNLIHRRDEFRGAQLNVNKVHDLNKSGKIKLFTKYQLKTVKAAISILESIFKNGYRYQKAGVMLTGLANSDGKKNLFSSDKDEKIKNLMKSIDNTNYRYGRSTLSLASAGVHKKWNMRREHSSKIDTADFYCVPTIRAT